MSEQTSTSRKTESGFTKWQAIIVAFPLFVALLFLPPFRRIVDNHGYSPCISKLQQIGQAVKMYRIDEGGYPRNILGLKEYMSLYVSNGRMTTGSPRLRCEDDRAERDHAYTDPQLPYCSYYDTSGRKLLWNYWGYTPEGFAYADDDPQWRKSIQTAGVTSHKNYPRLANPSAPDHTIITHCIHHRRHTGTNPNQQLDLVLRLDSSAKAIPWKGCDWVTQQE